MRRTQHEGLDVGAEGGLCVRQKCGVRDSFRALLTCACAGIFTVL